MSRKNDVNKISDREFDEILLDNAQAIAVDEPEELELAVSSSQTSELLYNNYNN